MEHLINWALGLVTIVIVALATAVKAAHTKTRSLIKDNSDEIDDLHDRVVRMECNFISEKDVRMILKEYIDPVVLSVNETNKIVRDIDRLVASMPKRGSDL